MILRVTLTQSKGSTPNPEKRGRMHRRSKGNHSGDPRTPMQMHRLLYPSNSKRKIRLSNSTYHWVMQLSQKIMTQEGLEPRKNNREKMALMRVEPIGLLTRNNKRSSKSPKRKMVLPVGVELTTLSLLSSKSTSKSHHRKTERAVQERQTTERTEEMHCPMVTEKWSTEISQK